MGMKKADATIVNGTTIAPQIPIVNTVLDPVQPESGATAAIERLSKPKAEATQKPKYVPRDLESEAIGKTRCVMFAAALQSPALAGLRFNDAKEFLAIVQEAADAGVAYSFQK